MNGEPALQDERLSPAQHEAVDLLSALVRAAGAVRGRLAEQLEAEVGLLPEEADLLLRLDAAPEQRLRMADVSRSLGVSKSGVTRLVDRLEDRGLLVRAPCPKDRRVVYAGLTDAGCRVVAEAAPVLAAGADAHLAGHLSAAEAHALLAGLRKVLKAEGGKY
jgi:MarR family transcriptional regulator, 2-MHQ and catechol-resistance regulon repressor